MKRNDYDRIGAFRQLKKEIRGSKDYLIIGIDIGKEGFRMRIGQFRIIYTRDDSNLIIEVVKIRPRGDIYRG